MIKPILIKSPTETLEQTRARWQEEYEIGRIRRGINGAIIGIITSITLSSGTHIMMSNPVCIQGQTPTDCSTIGNLSGREKENGLIGALLLAIA
jgi:hypothetical protein